LSGWGRFILTLYGVLMGAVVALVVAIWIGQPVWAWLCILELGPASVWSPAWVSEFVSFRLRFFLFAVPAWRGEVNQQSPKLECFLG